jgi:hypothetical protein
MALILGISWFFAIGAVLVGNFMSIVKNDLGATEEVVTLFLVIFSVSIAIGAMLVNRLLNGEVSARYVPAAALAMAGVHDRPLAVGRRPSPSRRPGFDRRLLREPGRMAYPDRSGRHGDGRGHVHGAALCDPPDPQRARGALARSSRPTISSTRR